MIDEFRTTQIQYGSNNRHSKVVEVSNGSKRTVRGLLWCCSTKGSKFINRDVEPSKQMVACYDLYLKRPGGLSRDSETLEAPQVKYIYKNSIEGEKVVDRQASNFFSRLYCGSVLPFTNTIII